jgi:3-oxoacyl-(acyl-carrier-protein) synthase
MLSVAITGVGVVAAGGTRLAELGPSPGVGRWLPGVDGPVDLSGYLSELQLRTFDRGSQLAVVAAQLAVEDAGGLPCAPASLGVSLGDTYGCLGPQIALDRVIVTEGPQSVSGSLFPYAVFNAAAANVAIVLGAKGPNITLTTGSAAGTDACAEAARQVDRGYADAMLAGGVEAPGADLRLWLDKLSVEASPTEGAALLVLESADAAARRGARVHGLIVGAASRVAGDGARAGWEQAAASCVRSALEEAGLVARDVRLVIGEDGPLAEPGCSVAHQSVESMFGETLSASGAFQVVLALLSIRHRAEPGAVLCCSRSREGVVSCLVVKPQEIVHIEGDPHGPPGHFSDDRRARQTP